MTYDELRQKYAARLEARPDLADLAHSTCTADGHAMFHDLGEPCPFCAGMVDAIVKDELGIPTQVEDGSYAAYHHHPELDTIEKLYDAGYAYHVARLAKGTIQ